MALHPRLLTVITLCCLFALLACRGKDSELNSIQHADIQMETEETASQNWNSFILPNYRALGHAKGDLNNDGREDVALALAQKNETTSEDGELPRRPLLLLIRQADNSLKLEHQNDTALMCFRCGGPMGDPFESIEINEGTLQIHHYGGSAWRWTNTVIFNYDETQKNWLLQSVKDTAFNNFLEDEESEIMTLKTAEDFGIITFTEFKID